MKENSENQNSVFPLFFFSGKSSESPFSFVRTPIQSVQISKIHLKPSSFFQSWFCRFSILFEFILDLFMLRLLFYLSLDDLFQGLGVEASFEDPSVVIEQN